MANVDVSRERIVRSTGLNPTETTLNASDTFRVENGDGKTFLRLQNDDPGQRIVTVVTQETRDGNAVADVTITIPTTEQRYWGPADRGIYNTNQRFHVTCDGGNVKMAALTI